MSRDRGSNPGPHPYHGCALPTELSRHVGKELLPACPSEAESDSAKEEATSAYY